MSEIHVIAEVVKRIEKKLDKLNGSVAKNTEFRIAHQESIPKNTDFRITHQAQMRMLWLAVASVGVPLLLIFIGRVVDYVL